MSDDDDDDDDDDTVCTICYEASPHCVTHYACGHWNCTTCYDRLGGWGQVCPMCREPILVRWFKGSEQLFARANGPAIVLGVDFGRTTWDCVVRMLDDKCVLPEAPFRIKLIFDGRSHWIGDTGRLCDSAVKSNDTLHLFVGSGHRRMDCYYPK